MQPSNFLATTLFAAAMLAASSAGAAVVYQVSVGSICGAAGLNETDSSAVPTEWATLDIGVTGGGCSADVYGVAGDGFLEVSGAAGSFADSAAQSYGSSATVNTSARFSEVSITTPASYTGGNITMALAFDLDATLAASVVDGGGSSSASSLLQASVVVSALGPGGGPDILVFEQEISVNDIVGDGIPPADALGISTVLVTDFFEMNPTAPMVITLGLIGSTITSAAFNDNAEGTVSAVNTFSFAADTPFILPEGFSVTYEDASIFDNQWIDPRPVPEPHSALLILAGLAGLTAARRRRR